MSFTEPNLLKIFVLASLMLTVACEGTIDPIRPFVRDAGPADSAASDAGPFDPDGGGDPRDGGPTMSPDGGPLDGGEPLDGGIPRDGGVQPSLPACTDSIDDITAGVLTTAPGRNSEAYVDLDATERGAVGSLVRAVLARDVEAVSAAQSIVGYLTCATPDGEVVLSPATSGQGGALAVIRPEAVRALVVEAPHALYEIETSSVARVVFDRLDALAMITTGTHRCANGAPSGCDGVTSACSPGPEPYTESDMAHNVNSAFHAFHVALLDTVATATAVSVHGKGGPGAILSNGTQVTTTAMAQIGRVVLAMVTERPSDAILTCNAFIGGTTAGQLCGTDNVQGRHANGSPNACSAEASVPSDRFIHMELSQAIRSDPEAIARALDQGLN